MNTCDPCLGRLCWLFCGGTKPGPVQVDCVRAHPHVPGPETVHSPAPQIDNSALTDDAENLQKRRPDPEDVQKRQTPLWSKSHEDEGIDSLEEKCEDNGKQKVPQMDFVSTTVVVTTEQLEPFDQERQTPQTDDDSTTKEIESWKRDAPTTTDQFESSPRDFYFTEQPDSSSKNVQENDFADSEEVILTEEPHCLSSASEAVSDSNKEGELLARKALCVQARRKLAKACLQEILKSVSSERDTMGRWAELQSRLWKHDVPAFSSPRPGPVTAPVSGLNAQEGTSRRLIPAMVMPRWESLTIFNPELIDVSRLQVVGKDLMSPALACATCAKHVGSGEAILAIACAHVFCPSCFETFLRYQWALVAERKSCGKDAERIPCPTCGIPLERRDVHTLLDAEMRILAARAHRLAMQPASNPPLPARKASPTLYETGAAVGQSFSPPRTVPPSNVLGSLQCRTGGNERDSGLSLNPIMLPSNVLGSLQGTECDETLPRNNSIPSSNALGTLQGNLPQQVLSFDGLVLDRSPSSPNNSNLPPSNVNVLGAPSGESVPASQGLSTVTPPSLFISTPTAGSPRLPVASVSRQIAVDREAVVMQQPQSLPSPHSIPSPDATLWRGTPLPGNGGHVVASPNALNVLGSTTVTAPAPVALKHPALHQLVVSSRTVQGAPVVNATSAGGGVYTSIKIPQQVAPSAVVQIPPELKSSQQRSNELPGFSPMVQPRTSLQPQLVDPQCVWNPSAAAVNAAANRRPPPPGQEGPVYAVPRRRDLPLVETNRTSFPSRLTPAPQPVQTYSKCVPAVANAPSLSACPSTLASSTVIATPALTAVQSAHAL